MSASDGKDGGCGDGINVSEFVDEPLLAHLCQGVVMLLDRESHVGMKQEDTSFFGFGKRDGGDQLADEVSQ